MEVEARGIAISKELDSLTDELEGLVGDEEEPGTLPKEYRRMTPEAARVELEAYTLAGDPKAAELLRQVERFAFIKNRKPVLERARVLARAATGTAIENARRAAYPKAAEAFKPVARRAALAFLNALPAVTAADDLHARLRSADVADATPNPFAGSPLVARRVSEAATFLQQLIAGGHLDRAEVEAVFPGLLA